MANLQKMKKDDLIKLCNERGGQIVALRNDLTKLQEKFDAIDKELQKAVQQKKHLEADMEGTIRSYNDEREECTKEIQALREKVTMRDKTIDDQVKTYSELRKEYDNLIYENGVNRSNVAKYKLAAIVAIIAFIVVLVFACI